MDFFDDDELASLADLVEESWTGTATIQQNSSSDASGFVTVLTGVNCRQQDISGSPAQPASAQGARPATNTAFLLSKAQMGTVRPTGDWRLIDEETSQRYRIQQCTSPRTWPYVKVIVVAA